MGVAGFGSVCSKDRATPDIVTPDANARDPVCSFDASVSQNAALAGHGYRSTMNRTTLFLAALAAAVVFAGAVYFVLRIAHVAEPAATTVQGPTSRRLWATAAAATALAGAATGAMALARPSGRFGTRAATACTALAGSVGAINGGLVLAFADGGPGSGNGVVGGAAALVLGVVALAWVCLGRTRSHTKP